MDSSVIEVVDRAYQAAVDPELWPAVLEGAADLFNAERSIIIDYRRSRHAGLQTLGFEAEALSQYFQVFQALNPIQAAINRAPPDQLEAAGVTTDQTWLDKTTLTGSAFYNDYFRQFDMHAALLVRLGRSGEAPTLNLLRSRRRGEFEGRDVTLAHALRGPLLKAYVLGERLKAERRAPVGFAEIVGRMSGAVLLADAGGRILHANPAAEALLAERDGLSSRPEGLRAASAEDSRGLARLIAAAAAPSGEPDPGGAISIARPSGRRALAVLVAPMASAAGRLALVSIADPEQRVSVPHARLRELYGLTFAESRAVAELVAGHEPKAIAERLGISLNTVRVQLARAMAKTGAQRQSELVLTVLRALGGWS